jgi:hypothetical protein
MVGRKKWLFGLKLVLGFILFTFVDAKMTKFMPTFVKTFNEIWQ